MALLEDLINQVSDERLRRDLLAAADKSKSQNRFGLVFEEHIPEEVALPGLPLYVGAHVHRRDQPHFQTVYQVAAIVNGTAKLEPVAEEGQAHEAAAEDLLVLKRFGEPIYPALKSLGTIERGGDRPYHAVINGENFHALQLMLYLYEGQADCIYIDPPYNTEATKWKYNNRFVDENDRWRHSKWLSFMEKRLRLARRLLKPDDGVLIVTIDEHEVHHLGMLLEQMFPTHLRHMVTIVHNPKGTYKKNFARVDEYAFFIVPPAEEDIIKRMPVGMFRQVDRPEQMDSVAEAHHEDYYLRRRGQESGFRHQRPNQFYAILVDEEEQEVVGVGPTLGADDDYDVTRHGGVVTVYPLDSRGDERVWRYSREMMATYIERGEIVVTGYSNRTGQGWVLNHRVQRNPTKRIKTVWWEKRHDAGMHGSELLSAYLGQAATFPFPKSVYAVRDCLDAVVADRPDALIIDFFVGSGTTYHATCLLNARDGGHRRSVVVTNNELGEANERRLHERGHYRGDRAFESHGIFESVTRPRIEAVTSGVRSDGRAVEGYHVWQDRRPYAEGFEENVEFFRIDYHDPDQIDLGRQFDAILPALWLTAGGAGPREPGVDNERYSIPKGGCYGVLFDEGRFKEFLSELSKDLEDITYVFFVTDSDEAYAEMRSQLPAGVSSSMLYRDYLRNFQIGLGRPR